MFLFVTNVDHYWKLQLVKTQRMADHVLPRPNGYIYNFNIQSIYNSQIPENTEKEEVKRL